MIWALKIMTPMPSYVEERFLVRAILPPHEDLWLVWGTLRAFPAEIELVRFGSKHEAAAYGVGLVIQHSDRYVNNTFEPVWVLL